MDGCYCDLEKTKFIAFLGSLMGMKKQNDLICRGVKELQNENCLKKSCLKDNILCVG